MDDQGSRPVLLQSNNTYILSFSKHSYPFRQFAHPAYLKSLISEKFRGLLICGEQRIASISKCLNYSLGNANYVSILICTNHCLEEKKLLYWIIPVQLSGSSIGSISSQIIKSELLSVVAELLTVICHCRFSGLCELSYWKLKGSLVYLCLRNQAG